MVRIRFAVIGTNWITDRFLEAAREVKDFSLEAVYSRTEKTARDFADKQGAVLTFTSVQQLAESNRVEAVYIASPNAFHAEQAIELMAHGKHVLCEKPLASHANEVQAMITAARQNKVLLMEAMKTTCMPNFQAIQQNLHKLGKIRRYIANFCKVSSRYDAYKEGYILNAFKPEFSNGSLMDLGVYGLYPMVTLFGPPSLIKASGTLLESGVDGQGSVVAEYEGMTGIVHHSKITNSYLPSEIQGEEGTLIIDKISEPEHLELHYKDGRTERLSVQQNYPSMYYEVEEFIKGIKTGAVESDINTHERSLKTMEIVDESRKQIGLVFPADKKRA